MLHRCRDRLRIIRFESGMDVPSSTSDGVIIVNSVIMPSETHEAILFVLWAIQTDKSDLLLPDYLLPDTDVSATVVLHMMN